MKSYYYAIRYTKLIQSLVQASKNNYSKKLYNHIMNTCNIFRAEIKANYFDPVNWCQCNNARLQTAHYTRICNKLYCQLL